ncbi:MAG: asparagine synthetase B [Myxococcota bacterium]
MGGLAGIVHFQGDPPGIPEVRAIMARQRHRSPGLDEAVNAFAEGPAVFAPDAHIGAERVVMVNGTLWGPTLDDVAVPTPAQIVDVAFGRFGLAALDRLEGEFALAVWDRQTEQLVLARDGLGTRPLFWCDRGGRLAFASELPALLSVSWVPTELDRSRLAEYLSFQVVHAPRTLIRGVKQVDAGNVVVAQGTDRKVKRYWWLNYAPPGTPRPPDTDVVDRLQRIVGRAVARRIPQAQPTGLYLSGGLGSSVIAAAAGERYLHLPSFTVGFADDPYPETPFAGRVATLMGLEHHEVVVGTAALAETFDATVSTLGHPIGHPAVLLQRALAQQTRAHVEVVLSGNGGEALFGGRQLDGLARDLRLAGWFQQLPKMVREPLSKWIGRNPGGRRLVTAPRDYALKLGLGGASLFSVEERTRLLRDSGLVRPGIRQRVLEPWYVDVETDPVNLVLHGLLRSTLAERALPRAERTAAAAGLDVRFPLLDADVVKAAVALPGASKVRRVSGSLHTRWPLRGMLAGVLPPVLVDRPKRSLPTPPGMWLAGPGRLFMESRVRQLLDDPFGLWQADAIEKLRADVTRSNAAGFRLWTLFVLDSWLRSF